MIMIGSDLAGNADDGQIKYIAFVIGTEEGVNKAHNRIGLREIHMVALNKKQRKIVKRKLEFNKVSIFGYCVKVERQSIIDEILNELKLQGRNTKKSKIQKHFDYLLWKKMEKYIKSFTTPKKTEIEEVIMQCDPDMTLVGISWKMKIEVRGRSYELADALVWFNQHKTRIKSCIELDFAKELREEMRRDLL